MDTPKSLAALDPVAFVKSVIAELKKVTWPTREETIKLTVVVIVISVGVGLFIGLTDSIFVKLTGIMYGR